MPGKHLCRWACVPGGLRFVTRYAITHIGTDGRRRLTHPAQGRNTHKSNAGCAEAISQLLNVKVNGNDIPGVYGEQAVGTFEVRAVPCWVGNHDPAGRPCEAE